MTAPSDNGRMILACLGALALYILLCLGWAFHLVPLHCGDSNQRATCAVN